MKQKPAIKIHSLLITASLLLIAIVVAVLVIANFQPKAWLISDTLSYPEVIPTTAQFPLGDILQESIRSNTLYQFPAHIIALGLKLVIPLNLVRIVYLGILLAVAGFGIFAFITRVLQIVTKRPHAYIPATAATLLYLASMMPIQTLYSLNMPVITAFAFIPALLATALIYLQTNRSRWLMLFGALNILAFEIGGSLIMFALTATCLGAILFILKPYLQTSWKRIVQVLIIFASVHLIWLVPAIMNPASTSPIVDFTVYKHLPLIAQLVDVGLFNNFSVLNNFASDWATHLNSPLIAGLIIAVAAGSVLIFFYLSWKVKGRLKLAFIIPLICHILIALINAGILIGSVTEVGIAPLKQLVGYIFTLGLATELAILIDTVLQRYWKRLAQNSITPWLIVSSAGILLAGLLMLPALQNHLYPQPTQVNLPESYTQLFAFFRASHTAGNIWYVTDAITANEGSFEYKRTAAILGEYALGQPLISLIDPHTVEIYRQLQDIVASGNKMNIKAVLEQNDIDWIIVDRVNINSETFTLDTPQIGPLIDGIDNLDILAKVDWLDASVTDLQFYRVNRKVIPTESNAQSTQDYPFANLPADRAEINAQTKTVSLFAQLNAASASSLKLPALDELNLENVSLEFLPQAGQLNIVGHGFYPQLSINAASISSALDSIQLATIPKPNSQYIIVIGEQIFGPFSSNSTEFVQVSKLNLKEVQNMRVYEMYDLNDVTATFQRQQAGDCDTNAQVFDTETLTAGSTITINSERESCLVADVPLIETDASVVTRVSFDYMTNALLSQCMFNKQSQACVNPATPIDFSDSSSHHQNVIEELGKVGTTDLQTKFLLKYLGAESVLSASISNITIAEYKLINSVTLSVKDWEVQPAIAVSGTPMMQASLPYSQSQIADFSSAEYFDSFKSCSDGQKLELINQAETRALRASSQNALCFYKDYLPVSADKAQLIFLDYKLANGATVDLCVWDVNRKVCVTQIDVKGRDFRAQLFIPVPRQGSGEANYRLIFSSLENIHSDFVISDIQLLEADSDALRGAYLTREDSEPSLVSPEQDSTNPTLLVEEILIFQGIILLICFGLPAGKEVLVNNIIKQSEEKNRHSPN